MTREEQAQYIYEKLMEDPEFKKAFVGAITDAVNEVVKVIKALQQEPCEDAISRQAAIDACLNGWNKDYKEIVEEIRALPLVKPQYTDAEIQKMQDLEFAEIQKAYEIGKAEKPNKWIPVKWHTITDEEREREGYPEEWVNHIDCVMPADEQEILITVKNRKGRLWVEKDTCYVDDGFYLDSGYDWVDDVVAWCELPEPYKASPTGEEVG